VLIENRRLPDADRAEVIEVIPGITRVVLLTASCSTDDYDD